MTITIGLILVYILAIMYVFARSFEIVWKDRFFNGEMRSWYLDRFGSLAIDNECNKDEIKHLCASVDYLNHRIEILENVKKQAAQKKKTCIKK